MLGQQLVGVVNYLSGISTAVHCAFHIDGFMYISSGLYLRPSIWKIVDIIPLLQYSSYK